MQGEVEVINTGQTLAEAQDAIAKTLQEDLNDTLGGPYFEGIKFRLRGVTFDPVVQEKITGAQAARTELATAKLEAQKRVEQAIGDRRVAEQKADAIRGDRERLPREPCAGPHRRDQGAPAEPAGAGRQHQHDRRPRAVRVVILLVVVCLLTALLYWFLRGWLAERTEWRPQQWRLQERSTASSSRCGPSGAATSRCCSDSVPIAAADFDMRLYELRVEAESKVDALNASRALERG